MKCSLILLFLVNYCYSANILILSCLPSPSHYIWHKQYAMTLAKNGHNVTIVTHEEEKQEIANYTMITIEGIYPKVRNHFQLDTRAGSRPLDTIKLLIGYDLFLCEYDPPSSGIKKLLDYPDDFKFDLIVLNVHTTRCLYPIIDRFKSPPILGTSPIGTQPYVLYPVGNPLLSTIPFLHFHTTDKMTLLERLENFFYVHLLNMWWRYSMIPAEQKLAEKFFGPNIKQIHEYERQISMFLVNSDPVVNYPQALYPNVVNVAGIHIPPIRELPKDIKEILDKAKYGVIYVSFGTNLDIAKMKPETRQAFIDAFRRLPQTILMKTKSTEINMSENVISKPWLSQNDILAHPNVKVFVTHGGALSTQEAMYHGVPVIGVPFNLDQHGNIAKLHLRKLGKMLKFSEITSNLVYEAIKELLDNPIYKDNMMQLSKRFRDQPQTPLERALFWTEYVMRHGGAEHFSPSTRDMNMFQRLDLDIYGLILGAILALLLMIYLLFNSLRQKLRKEKVD